MNLFLREDNRTDQGCNVPLDADETTPEEEEASVVTGSLILESRESEVSEKSERRGAIHFFR